MQPRPIFMRYTQRLLDKIFLADYHVTGSPVRRGHKDDPQSGRTAVVGAQAQQNRHEIRIAVEELKDGGDYHYVATSPDLPGLLVAGETVEEVLVLTPKVAAAFAASIQNADDSSSDTMTYELNT